MINDGLIHENFDFDQIDDILESYNAKKLS